MNIEDLLDDELAAEFETLRKSEPGSDEHKAAGDMLTKLMDRKIEMEKVKNECADKAAVREDEKKDRLTKNILGAAGIILPLLVTIWGTRVSLKFEEEGTFTTIMGRGFINKLLPKK